MSRTYLVILSICSAILLSVASHGGIHVVSPKLDSEPAPEKFLITPVHP